MGNLKEIVLRIKRNKRIIISAIIVILLMIFLSVSVYFITIDDGKYNIHVITNKRFAGTPDRNALQYAFIPLPRHSFIFKITNVITITKNTARLMLIFHFSSHQPPEPPSPYRTMPYCILYILSDRILPPIPEIHYQ